MEGQRHFPNLGQTADGSGIPGVVRAGGNLGGYAGGADRKAFLLALEQEKNK